MDRLSKNWDIFDVLFAHEDSYTNCLQYLFENNRYFYSKFSELLFGEKVINDLAFYTRTVYTRKDNNTTAQKDIPDIIICNKDHFCIVEVKINAKEGYEQTNRYYSSSDNIKAKLGIHEQAVSKYYFLTLYGEESSNENFKPLSWAKVGECLPAESAGNAMIDLLSAHLHKRTESIKQKINQEMYSEILWKEALSSNLWKNTGDILSDIINNSGLLPEEAVSKGFINFLPTQQTTTTMCQVWEKSNWIGKSQEDYSIKSDPKDFYNIHIELQWNPTNHTLLFALHYEFNPYLSGADIRRIDDVSLRRFVENCGEIRNAVMHNCREVWRETYQNNTTCRFNSGIRDNVYTVFTAVTEIDDCMTVSDVITEIQPHIKLACEFTDEVLLPEIKRHITSPCLFLT